MTEFVKMHGCGNDFVVLRWADLQGLAVEDGALAAWIRKVCDRHKGLGADGVLAYGVLAPDRLRMHYWNRDGSRAEMCGNGARCIVRLAFDRGEVTAQSTLVTDVSTHPVRVRAGTAATPWIEVRLGAARWDPGVVGLTDGQERLEAPMRLGTAEHLVSALDLGNPHAVVFLPHREALDAVSLETEGLALAGHPLFARGANASFAAVHDGELYLRVYERGVGPTLACGSASCAAVAVGRRLGRLHGNPTRVHLPGGVVEVEVDAEGFLWLGGPATLVAEGRLLPELLQQSSDAPG